MASHLKVWENYRKFSEERGWLVATILQKFISLEGKKVLDYGCGDGGTSQTLAKLGAEVTSVDIKPELEQFCRNSRIVFFNAQNRELYLKAQRYDIVILQDVLEHVLNPEQLIKEINYSLRSGGLIYLSTPNRFSLLNIISDPHWNLPGVALFPRSGVIFFVREICRRDCCQRTDWAALLSLSKLKKIMATYNFDIKFVNSLVAKILFQRPQAVICHPRQLRFIQWMKDHLLDRWIYRLVNDRIGIFNFLINPTWYVIGRAK